MIHETKQKEKQHEKQEQDQKKKIADNGNERPLILLSGYTACRRR